MVARGQEPGAEVVEDLALRAAVRREAVGARVGVALGVALAVQDPAAVGLGWVVERARASVQGGQVAVGPAAVEALEEALVGQGLAVEQPGAALA